MSNDKEKNYYIKKKRTFMRLFDAALTIVKDILIENFGERKFNELSVNARNDFEFLLSQLPYIGGNENPLTDNLVNGALLIPILRFFEKEGLTFDEIGKLAYDLYESFYKIMPPRDDIFSENYLNDLRKKAKNSKLRKHTGDWVYDFVEGDGINFSWGVDYSECGLHKFYKSQGLEHLMPIVCIADYAMAREYGYGLKRTQTRAHGAPICDFRYIKDGKTPRAWPPDNLSEFKKK